MSDLISREALLKEIQSNKLISREYATKRIVECINNQPTVNAVELPCKLGDYCWFEDKLYYVAGIFLTDDIGQLDLDEKFTLMLSDAHKEPIGVETLISQVRFISEEEAKKVLEAQNG